MLMNFLGEFKSNFNFLKVKILNTFKKLNYLVILDNFILILCLLLLSGFNALDTLLNVSILNVLLLNSFLFYVILFLLSTSNLILNKIYYKSNSFNNENWNSLYLQILYSIYLRMNIKSNVIYIYYNFLFLIQSLFLNSSYIFKNLNFRTLYWYPIFKRHSIFGYYRIARQNWVELKSEEVNYLKY